MENLVRQFKKIGLTLKPWKRNDEIFAMNIEDSTFTLQVGEGNNVQVQNADKDMKQLVLMIHEKPRSFEVQVPKSVIGPRDIVLRNVNERSVIVRRTTPEEKRHLLLGLDEMNHPFITRLTGPAVTVKAAHESLKPPELRGKTVKGRGKNYRKGQKDTDIARQGEWFFVETDKTTREFLASKENLLVRKLSLGVAWNGRAGGNAHTADEVLTLPSSGSGEKFVARRVFVRGKVRHAEHKTLSFLNWVRVLHNTEADARAAGVSWVD